MNDKNKNLDDCSPSERARIIAVSKLIHHFRGLENANLMDKEIARKYIGSVIVLENLIKGTFKERPSVNGTFNGTTTTATTTNQPNIKVVITETEGTIKIPVQVSKK